MGGPSPPQNYRAGGGFVGGTRSPMATGTKQMVLNHPRVKGGAGLHHQQSVTVGAGKRKRKMRRVPYYLRKSKLERRVYFIPIINHYVAHHPETLVEAHGSLASGCH